MYRIILFLYDLVRRKWHQLFDRKTEEYDRWSKFWWYEPMNDEIYTYLWFKVYGKERG